MWLLFNRTYFYVLVVALPVVRGAWLGQTSIYFQQKGAVFPLETSIFLEMIPLKEKVFA